MSTTHSSPPRVRRIRRSAVIGATLAAALVGWAVPAAAQPAAPAFPAQVAPTPVGFDLYAVSGTTNLPGLPSVPVWGYSSDGTGVTKPGGPTLVVHQGDAVTITLHNTLGETNSLVVRGQSMRTDRVGASASTGTRTYTFTADEVGTFLYEAGPLANSPHQVAMGLYGAFVVLPSSGTPYGSDSDAMVLISEIDPALNGSAQPAVFDMRKFAPKYTLINGTAYPVTAQLGTPAPDDDVLLRYVNAGISYHSMSVLGATQRIVADGGHPLAQPYSVVAQTVGPGQTTDAVLHVSVNAAAGTKLAVFDGNLQVRNRNRRPATTTAAVTYGGAMAFLEVAGTVNTADTTGPVASNLVATNTTINAHISDVTTGGSNVSSAEYSIDGGPPVAFGGTFGAAEVDVSATFGALGAGSHTIRVRGTDSAPIPNTGSWASVVVSNDNVGPVSTGLKLTPNPSNGLVTVALHATGSDAATGGSNIKSAVYTIDNGPATPMTLGGSTVTTSLDATIPAGLSEGDHPITVVATDSFDNPGPAASTVLTIDKTGPTTSAVAVAPTATNGTVGVNSSTPAVRVTASATDPVSNIVAAEGFIDTVGAFGSGFIFLPVDGAWNSKTESLTVDVPLTTINALSPGTHTIYVRAKDASGNWETPHLPATALPSTTLIVDKTAPVVTSATLSPNTITPGVASVTLNVAATDPLSGVASWQYWVDGTTTPPANPTSFSGTSATINTAALAAGSHTVNVRVKDVAGNWSAVTSRALYVVLAVNDARSITASGTTGTQTSDANANNGVLTNDQPVGVAGRTAQLLSAPIRTSGSGTAVLTLSCPASLGTAGSAIGPNTICTNGAYRVNLSAVGNNNNQRAAARRGTFSFTYTESLNGVTSPATVTITVN